MPWAASWQNFKSGPDSDPAVRPRPRAKGQSLGPVSRGQPAAARPGQWSIADRRAAVGGAAAESMSRARAPPVSHHSRGATALGRAGRHDDIKVNGGHRLVQVTKRQAQPCNDQQTRIRYTPS